MTAINKLGNSITKHTDIGLYLIFGCLATLINMGVYYVTYSKLGISNVLSSIIAWVVAVLFAFVTNKLVVFGSRSTNRRVLVFEIVSFFGCRIGTGLLDVATMYVTVDLFVWNPMLMKLLSNGMQTVLNYIASKLVIFRKK